MESAVKSSAIVFGGYLYQNLIGLELLCDWLDDPSRYKWVRFEADAEEFAKGLDDVVAARADDGALILLQVKFAVDPYNQETQLDWRWLLQKKGNGRSLLQKWADALDKYGSTQVSEVALVTNRIPDKEFASCLGEEGRHVELEAIPAQTLLAIQEQLGTAERTEAFFARFEFQHSHKRFKSLQHALHDRYVPVHTSHHGWLELRTRAVDWALLKNSPPPDGRITLEILRGVLETQRPEPLSQSFRVPPSYCPPDEEFHSAFIDRISSADRPITVLWGSPGQGKSTYLSFVCAKLEADKAPFIRHHYFLHLTDTSDRFSFPSVANSLMAQMEIHHSAYVSGQRDSPETLRNWIAACGAGYLTEGKRFIVVIDGLDHVWRESDHDRRMLDSLFRHLLPVPENVSLVLGTQKVSAEQLPQHLTRFASDEDWIELPRMSLFAVRAWLELQLNAKRFDTLDRQRSPSQDPMRDLAEAFHEISQGHPLHLTYSFETLARESRVLDPEQVRQLTACPQGDIRIYYRTLWNSLSPHGKEALHLVAGAGFVWPQFGLEDCLAIRPGSLTREVGYLFYPSEAGIIPFHGSIIAFVRELPEHDETLRQLVPRLIIWLEHESPTFHRWGWLWLFKARAGDVNDLLNGPTRQWVIDSVAGGYPPSQIAEILAAAERLAFDATDFPRAIRFRWLKIRLHNGAEFQVTNFGRIQACALALAEDDYLLKSLSARFDSASSAEICLLGTQYARLSRADDAAECAEELRKRINDRLAAHAYDDRLLQQMCEEHLTLLALTGRYLPKLLMRSVRGLGSLAPSLFRHFLRELSKRCDVSLLAAFLPLPMPLEMRRDLERALIRLAGACDVPLHEWPDFVRMRKHPIVACWANLYCRSKAVEIRHLGGIKHLDKQAHSRASDGVLERHLHCVFFEHLSKCLSLGGAPPPVATLGLTNREWLDAAIAELLGAAASIGSILSRGDLAGFSHCYLLLSQLSIPNDYEARVDYHAMQSAVLEISTDLFLLTRLRTGAAHISAREWRAVTHSPHFNFELWRERYVACAMHVLSPDDIAELVDVKENEEAARISRFNERADLYLGLSELALTESLVDRSRRILQRAVGCVMSYGWRKDMTVFHVLSAIESVSVRRPDIALARLVSICPAISEIDQITDGDETRHAKLEMAELLLSLLPSAYTAYYEFLLKSAEWYEAERTFAVLMAKDPLDSAIMKVPTAVLWGAYEVTALRDRANEGDEDARALAESNERQFGFRAGELGKERDRSTGSATDDDGDSVQVEGYEPHDVSRLIEDLRHRSIYVGETDVLHRWFDHWVNAGRGLELLRAIEPLLEGDNVPSGITELLDEAFELSRRLQGKSSAYRWIVAAHIHRHGWSDHWSTAAALARLRTFAKHYPNKWKEFVRDTSRPAYRHTDERLVIPHHRLVQLLVDLDQMQVAIDVTNEMVSSLLLEVSEQPLTRPVWLAG